MPHSSSARTAPVRYLCGSFAGHPRSLQQLQTIPASILGDLLYLPRLVVRLPQTSEHGASLPAGKKGTYGRQCASLSHHRVLAFGSCCCVFVCPLTAKSTTRLHTKHVSAQPGGYSRRTIETNEKTASTRKASFHPEHTKALFTKRPALSPWRTHVGKCSKMHSSKNKCLTREVGGARWV